MPVQEDWELKWAEFYVNKAARDQINAELVAIKMEARGMGLRLARPAEPRPEPPPRE